MKVFCSVPKLRANGARLKFKNNLRPAAFVSFTKRENFKNFKEYEEVVNLPLEARITNRAVDVRSLGFEACVKAVDREVWIPVELINGGNMNQVNLEQWQ